MLEIGRILSGMPGKLEGVGLFLWYNLTQSADPPVFISATTNTSGTIITITFDKGMADPSGKQSEFSATIAESARSISSASLNVDNTKIDLTISGDAIESGATVTVDYTKGTVVSADGGALASFVAQSVANIVVSPYQTPHMTRIV